MIPIVLIIAALLVSPVIVDAVGQMPDAPLYGVARIGEQMQVSAGTMSNSQVAEKRIYEYAYIAKKTGASPQSLLTENGVALNAAEAKNEMQYGASVAYTSAVLNYVAQSTEYTTNAQQEAYALTKQRGYGESGFYISPGGIPEPLPRPGPIGELCMWRIGTGTGIIERPPEGCYITGATQVVGGTSYYEICCGAIVRPPPVQPPVQPCPECIN